MYSDVEKESELLSFLLFFLVHIVLLVGVLVVWIFVWLRKIGVDIYEPIGNENRKSGIGKINQTQRSVRTHAFGKYWKTLCSKI